MNGSGEAYGLRRMTTSDLEQVLEWRNSERIRNSMYQDHIIGMDEHERWFANLQSNGQAVPYIFELHGEPSGFIHFSGFDWKNNRCSWGFYLGSSDLPQGTGMAMGRLGLRVAFEELKVHKLCGEALGYNNASIRFHLKLGFKQEGRFMKHVLKNGIYEDIVVFGMLVDDYREEISV